MFFFLVVAIEKPFFKQKYQIAFYCNVCIFPEQFVILHWRILPHFTTIYDDVGDLVGQQFAE